MFCVVSAGKALPHLNPVLITVCSQQKGTVASLNVEHILMEKGFQNGTHT